ncbi:DmsC/YnfH family molybdoenzyme membrane anchor subunit [Pelagicoccus sp. SDUM812002]|uniref:DmsC/YnfH family molybdoenzyme membrane anchor subunit n=1 Tax=Pelagicoccus sp. SDUM812002 TaxID=3041266 RepID=UPI00280C7E1C|nr:DmsC/YnfH family molybdoenzyme membrane anchor subunit [Pelagicoccus sp. SDUM812002]MDQ8187156.1 dimethyl sulfoxide reductase anchor subunit [Pelagicoccus sp. SDUM812002]
MSELIELKEKTLIDMLLEEQQQVETPVGRLAEAAERASAERTGSFGDLIPLSAPRKGEQYAFQVDLDRCSGCKGCVTACHSLNGLDENETWRDIGMLVGEGERGPALQTVTTACHHCVEPACMIGCPVDAYEKDEASGIVLHLDDQCIGCQYCVLKCPYDVPKFSPKRGIVRKCDMCHSRLSSGEAPACVQACPHEAIKIVTVEKEEVVARSKDADSFLPDSPEPGYTKPTTRYISKKGLPQNMMAGDSHVLRVQHTHWPLVGLLALSQIGVGGFVASALGSERLQEGAGIASLLAAWVVFHLGLVCSALHLGQPLKAWRVFLGFRRSWLSREAVILGACSAISCIAVGAVLAGRFGYLSELAWVDELKIAAVVATALSGLMGVFTSVYIYVDTQRSFWRLPYSLSKFYGSVLLGALAFGMIAAGGVSLGIAVAFVGIVVLKMVVEKESFDDNRVSKGLVTTALSGIWRARLSLGALSCVAAVAATSLDGAAGGLLVLMLVCSGELLERVLYFKSVNAPKMPGGLNG